MQIRERLAQVMEEHGFTQADVGKATNFSKSTINLYCSGKYSADVTNIENSIAAWLRRLTPSSVDDHLYPSQYIDIKASKTVKQACSQAQEGEFVCVYGPPGCGKTVAIQDWARVARHEGVRFAVVSANVTTTHAQLIFKIAAELNLHAKGTAAGVLDRIVAKLRSEPSVIIIDEAQHLGIKALEAARAIYDETGCGVALVGSMVLYRTLMEGDDSKIELRQLQSRIRKYSVSLLDTVELNKFVILWLGVDHAKTPDKDLLARLRHHSRNTPRSLVRLLTNARQMARHSHAEISPDLIDAAAKRLMQEDDEARN
jgi:DNA transposition AAA+ family ATPase